MKCIIPILPFQLNFLRIKDSSGKKGPFVRGLWRFEGIGSSWRIKFWLVALACMLGGLHVEGLRVVNRRAGNGGAVHHLQAFAGVLLLVESMKMGM